MRMSSVAPGWCTAVSNNPPLPECRCTFSPSPASGQGDTGAPGESPAPAGQRHQTGEPQPVQDSDATGLTSCASKATLLHSPARTETQPVTTTHAAAAAFCNPWAEGKQSPGANWEGAGSTEGPYLGEEGPGDKVLVFQEGDPLAAVQLLGQVCHVCLQLCKT